VFFIYWIDLTQKTADISNNVHIPLSEGYCLFWCKSAWLDVCFPFFLWEQCMFSFLIRAPCKSQFQVFFFLSRMSKKVKTRELLVPRSAECSLLSSSTPTHPRALMIFRAPWKACLLILHQTNGCILPCLKVFAAAAVNRTAVGAFTRIVLLLAHILAACRLAIFRGEAPKQWWRHWWRLRAWACGAYT